MPPDRSCIVLVDDSADIRETFSELLEDAGYHVVSCADGLEALLCIGATRPDAIVLDLMLTDISGFDVYRTLKGNPEFAGVPVVFVSGVILDEGILRARVGEPTARLLLKPVTGEVLIEEIEAARARAARAA